jgi:hypothetical protein
MNYRAHRENQGVTKRNHPRGQISKEHKGKDSPGIIKCTFSFCDVKNLHDRPCSAGCKGLSGDRANGKHNLDQPTEYKRAIPKDIP